MFKLILPGLLLAIGLQAPIPAAAAPAAAPPLYQPRPGAAARPAAPHAPAQRSAVVEDGRLCSTLDFEGIGELAPIPAIDGITMPNWKTLVDADAGGSGNFAQEPSPDTVAFWLDGDSGVHDIVLAERASKVEFFYTSAAPVTVLGLSDAGLPIVIAAGLPNFNQGTGDPTGDYNRWDSLVLATEGNVIKTVRVFGNANQTAIDNLKVCRTIGVAAVEMTQAIQQFQTLDELKDSLRARREPPVPVVAGKAGVLRVYMQTVAQVTDVTVRLTGQVNQTRTVTLQPNCTPEDQRRERAGCRAVDFYFTPPEGRWDVGIQVLGAGGQVIENHALPFKSRKTDAMIVRAVSVCDAKTAAGTWQCAPASSVSGNITLLRRIAPTRDVSLEVTNSFVRREGSKFADPLKWWSATVRDTNKLYGVFDAFLDQAGLHRAYYGVVRTEGPKGYAGLAVLGGHGAIGQVTNTRFGIDTLPELIAHEVEHTLGLDHTGNEGPAATSAPGCYSVSKPGSKPDWPFADTRIQSAARLEVGFDVAARTPLMPETTFEMTSYCTPRWTSPLRYKRALSGLDGGAVTTPSALPREADEADQADSADAARPRPLSVVDGRFWEVAGTIESGTVHFDTLFDDATRGAVETGEGTHRIEVRGAGGAVLYTRAFTPDVTMVEDSEAEVPPAFHELVPFNEAAASIAVVGPEGETLGELALGGAAPAVTLLPLPGKLAGEHTIAWQVADPDSSVFASKVLYSANGGATWSQLAQLEGELALQTDFDALPGGDKVLIKVAVSDGVNTGSAISPPLTVPKKIPRDVRIVHPAAGAVFAPQALVQLEGSAYDVDDGMLDGDAIVWTSSLDGVLGTGAVLNVTTLRPGTHTITMRATDTDGNAVSATRTLQVAGAAPALQLQVAPLGGTPGGCMEATMVVQPDPGGVGLVLAEYSLDGGVTWINVPLNRLPYKFRVPGSGFIHLVARVFDQARQVTARDAKFFASSACTEAGPPRIEAKVVRQSWFDPGVLQVELALSNTGSGAAEYIEINDIAMRTLAGSGAVGLSFPSFPYNFIGSLAPGASTTLILYFGVPQGVRRFSVAETGRLLDSFGRPLRFSISQSIIP
jgi:hypothetical protein